ncbi:hypothetical protein K378_05828 [Streptomyces sp. Amel2xB2]|uniref:PDGLE domain-containing protein n=1 Tax=Streptomyces nanshensis TaxID=518642 RepID=A0A1E7KKL2_9ACTN|nr:MULTISPECIES: hypothetical protein [Streptomyces]OEV04430.1 hypothetical protein AN218_32045 [Streptomyces nanshensis]RAJ55717.1 hypothetical protein K378_05828 [Streptomyces sp. Amel2xB2]
MTKPKLFVLAAVLIVLGIGLFVWEPAGPEAECAKDTSRTSGFVDEEKNCPISIESYERIREAKSGPQWDNIGGLVLVVGGIGVAITAAVRKSRTTA